jgi:hypothetical protein
MISLEHLIISMGCPVSWVEPWAINAAWGPLLGPEIPKLSPARFQKIEGFTPDDDRLNTHVQKSKNAGPIFGTIRQV